MRVPILDISNLPSKVAIQNSSYTYAPDAQASDAYAITLSPAVTAYVTGQQFSFKANTANTGAGSLNVNGLGAKTIKKLTDQDLATGDIEVGTICLVEYDGTNFQLLSSVAQVSAGGQTLYQCIVATSGGDYTTLGSALTAGMTRIFIRNGTYSESAINVATADLIITGESSGGVILSFGANSMTLSGANVVFENITMLTTTGTMNFYGDYQRVLNNEFESSGTTNIIARVEGGSVKFIGNNIIDTSVSTITTATDRVLFGGNYPIVTNNYFKVRYGTATGVKFGGVECDVSNNRFEVIASVAMLSFVNLASAGSIFTNNIIFGSGVTDYLIGAGASVTISNNYLYNGARSINVTSNRVIITGNNIRIVSAGSLYGIYINGVNYITIANNYFRFPSTASPHTGIYVNSNSDNISITGNHMESMYNGINLVDTTLDDISIVGNNFDLIGNKSIVKGTQNVVMMGNFGDRLDITQQSNIVEMQNTSGGTVSQGGIVTFKSVASGIEVTTTTTLGDNKVFGMALESIANNGYGKIQILGYTTLLKVNGTVDIAIGDYISCFSVAGIGYKAIAGETAIAIALEAYTGNDSNGVIDALLINPLKI